MLHSKHNLNLQFLLRSKVFGMVIAVAILFLLCLGSLITANVQPPIYQVMPAASNKQDYNKGLGFDNSGNLIVAFMTYGSSLKFPDNSEASRYSNTYFGYLVYDKTGDSPIQKILFGWAGDLTMIDAIIVNDNIYFAFSGKGSCSFEMGFGNLMSINKPHFAIAYKLDIGGSQLRISKQINFVNDMKITGLAVNPTNEDFFFTGYAINSGNSDLSMEEYTNAPFSINYASSTSGYRPFMIKVDSDNNAKYRTSMEFNGAPAYPMVAVPHYSMTFVGGWFTGVAAFKSGVNLQSSGSGDPFVVKYDGAGNYMGAFKGMATTTSNFECVTAMHVDTTNGHLYVATYTSTSTKSHLDSGFEAQKATITKYEITQFSVISTTEIIGDVYIWSMAYGDGQLVAVGQFKNTIIIGDSNYSSISGSIDILKVGISDSGIWSRVNGDTGDDFANSIIYKSKTFYVSGTFTQNVDLDSFNYPTVSVTGVVSGGDIFTAKYGVPPFSCNSIDSELANACNSRGKCVAKDTCVCDSSYLGPDCEFTYCNGIPSNDTSRVCNNGNGTCTAFDTCSCNSHFGGQNCEYFYCNGFLGNDSRSCGNGHCVDFEVCKCDLNWLGNPCNITYCFGEMSNSSAVCSSHGDCLSFDMCKCSSGAAGKDCSISVCGQYLANDTRVCNSKGTCTDSICYCKPGWFGENCDILHCGTKFSNESVLCSGRGECVDPEIGCVCHNNSFGQDCDITTCFEYQSNDTRACSGFPCLDFNICSCPSHRSSYSNCSLVYEYVNYQTTLKTKQFVDFNELDNIPLQKLITKNIVSLEFSNDAMFIVDKDTFTVWKVKDGIASKFIGNGNAPNGQPLPVSFIGNIYSVSVEDIILQGQDFIFLTSDGYIYARNGDNFRRILGGSQTCVDNGLANDCAFPGADFITTDGSDTVYVLSSKTSCLKKIGLSSGKIQEFAGACDGPGDQTASAQTMRWRNPTQILFWLNMVYVVDPGNYCIGFVSAYDLSVGTIMGTCGDNSTGLQLSKIATQDRTNVLHIDSNVIRLYYGQDPIYLGDKSRPMADIVQEGVDGLQIGIKPTYIANDRNHDKYYFVHNKKQLVSFELNSHMVHQVAGHEPWSDEDQDLRYLVVQSQIKNLLSIDQYLYFTDEKKLRRFDLKESKVNTIMDIEGPFLGYAVDPVTYKPFVCDTGSIFADGNLVNYASSITAGVMMMNKNRELVAFDTAAKNLTIITENKKESFNINSNFNPSSISQDEFGNYYLAYETEHVIRKVTESGSVSVIGGQSVQSGYSADGTLFSEAKLNGPSDVKVANGQIFIVEGGNNIVRKVLRNGKLRTIAGKFNQTGDSEANNVLATDIKLDGIHSIAFFGSDNINIFISEDTKLRILTPGCDDGFYGDQCKEFYCNNIPRNSTNVCNGKGTCIAMNQCSCEESWTGANCETPICYEIAASNSSVCSSQGNCISNNTCQCNEQFSGEKCSIPKCYGVAADNTTHVCSGKGICVDVDSCQCQQDYLGQDCDIQLTCFGKNQSTACSNNGECSSIDNCTCQTGWIGNECQTPTCFNLTAPSACSGFPCIQVDTCDCPSNRSGLDCSTIVDINSNNSTTSNNSISSNDTQISNNSTVNNGTVFENSTTPDNSTTFNSTTIDNSTTISNNTSNNSNNTNFTNNTNNTNNSSNGESPINCFGIVANSTTVCSSHGHCVSTDSCHCLDGYYGQECETTTCYGVYSNNSGVCSGHGECSSPDSCTCYAFFYGAYCNESSGIKCTDAETCNGNGKCDDFGQCSCYSSSSKGYWSGIGCDKCLDNYFGEGCLTSISNVRFNDEGTAILVQLVNPASFSGLTVDCKNLVNLPLISSLGTNPKCIYSNKNTFDFKIELDQDHSFQIGSSISLNQNVFFPQNIPKYSNFVIGNAANPKSPIISLNYKEKYGSCEDIVIDGSESFALDGKYVNFAWEIVNSGVNSNQIWNQSKLSISNTDIPVGDHTFRLTITSYVLKLSSSKQFSIKKLDYSTPIISIDGSSTVDIYTTDLPLVIRKITQLPSCLPSDAKVVVEWSLISGTSIQYSVDSFNNLKIGSITDLDQNTFIFQVSTFIQGSTQKSSTTVTINLKKLPLLVNINGYQEKENLVRLEVEETDPNNDARSFVRSWSFKNVADSSTLLNTLSANSAVFEISSNQVKETVFEIGLTSSKGQSSSFSSVQINFTPTNIQQIPPSIILANSPQTKVNQGDLLNIQFIVNSLSTKYTREWSLDGSTIPSAMIDNRLPLTDSNSIVFLTSLLEEGSSHVITFKVTDSNNLLSASYTHSFTINKTPKPCTCQVSPSSGIALTTVFTFACPTCQNEAKSLKLEYGFVDDKTDANIILSKDDIMYQKLPIPYSGNDLSLYVTVLDTATGAKTTTKQKVTITLPYAKSPIEIKQLSKEWDKVSQLLPVGDYKRSVFNSATIARTISKMYDKLISISKRSICSGHGDLNDSGNCLCMSGFTGSNCRWSIEEFEIVSNISQTLIDNLKSSQQIVSNNGEVIGREFMSSVLMGIDSVLENYETFTTSQTVGMLEILNSTLSLIELSASLQLSGSDERYFTSILDLLYFNIDSTLIESYSQIYKRIGNLLLRNAVIGRNAIEIINSYGTSLMNKHFKDELNSMVLKAENVDLTLPVDLSSNIKLKLAKNSVSYQFNVIKNKSLFTLPSEVQLVSSICEMVLTPSISKDANTNFNYKFKLGSIPESGAVLSCAQISFNSYNPVNCSISIIGDVAECNCPSLYGLIGVLRTNNQVIPIKSESHINPGDVDSNGLSVLFWILWAILIAGGVACCTIVIIVVIVLSIKKAKKKENHYPEHEECPKKVEMKPLQNI